VAPADATGITSGLTVLQQIEVVEGISAIVVLVAMMWLLGAGKLVIGRHFDDLKAERDRWRDLFLDRLRNGPRQDKTQHKEG
jgi:hypothetical protein